MLQLEDLPTENAGSRFCRNSVTCSLSHKTSHPTEQKTRFILLTKSHSHLRVWTAVNCSKILTAILTRRNLAGGTGFLYTRRLCSCWPSYRLPWGLTHANEVFWNHVTHVVCFLLSNSSGSEFYMPTFRNTVLSS